MISACIKYMEDGTWKTLPVSELVGQTVLSYLEKTERRTVAALLEDGKAKLYVCTRQEDVDFYSKKGLAFTPAGLRAHSAAPSTPYVAGVMADGSFVKIRRGDATDGEDGASR